MNDYYLTLMDYLDRKISFRIGKFEDILRIDILIISGDEFAIVTNTRGKIKVFDSCVFRNRVKEYYDGKYCLYLKNEINHIKEFDSRVYPYECLDKWEDEEIKNGNKDD